VLNPLWPLHVLFLRAANDAVRICWNLPALQKRIQKARNSAAFFCLKK
jgi:hypothetical protein